MIRSARTLSHQQKQIASYCIRRSHATSTMGTMSNPGPNSEQKATISIPVTVASKSINKSQGFSTAVTYDQQIDIFDTLATSNFANVQDMAVYGKELDFPQAVALHKSKEKVFDKILILFSHGEAAFVTKEQSRKSFGQKEEGDVCLTSHGIGQALKISGKTANFCNDQTGLIPNLFVTSPVRCAVESALLSFPYYSPGSIYGTKWVYHGACHDIGTIESKQSLENSFPGIDSTFAHDQSDFLSWLRARDEYIISISSTPTWIDSFCNKIEPGHGSSDLRIVGIKFSSL